MASPGIGGRPTMKKKSGRSAQGQKHRAAGGGERPRSISAGRAPQARGTRPHHRTGASSFLDQTDEERARDVGVASGGSPARHEPAPRAKSNKSGGKVHRGPAWTSTRGNDEPSLNVGNSGSQSSGRSFFDSCKSAANSITGSASELWRESGSGSKRGKDKQGGSGKRTTLFRRYNIW